MHVLMTPYVTIAKVSLVWLKIFYLSHVHFFFVFWTELTVSLSFYLCHPFCLSFSLSIGYPKNFALKWPVRVWARASHLCFVYRSFNSRLFSHWKVLNPIDVFYFSHIHILYEHISKWYNHHLPISERAFGGCFLFFSSCFAYQL